MFPILYTATVMPFAIFFIEDASETGWYVVDIVITVLFLIDLVMNFNIGYYDAAGYPVVNRCVPSA
jgi:hypothetical protein